MIYLDNAASSHPKPMEVIRAVSEQLRGNGANPGRSGHAMSMQASKTIFSCRSTLAEAFGTEPETVIFTMNTTDGINRVLKGILKSGDHAIISDLEHNSVLRPLVALQDCGVTFSIAKTYGQDEKTVESFLTQIKPNTRLVFCTHASNVTGQILPVRSIGAECRRKGIYFAVDGAQTAGILAYDLKRDPIDFLCIPGHKGLLGPQGTGALLLKTSVPMTTIWEGGTGSDSLTERQPLTYPEGFESGTLNTPGIAGLREGVKFTLHHGEFIRKHEENLRNFFIQEIRKNPDFHVLGQGENFVGTVALASARGDSEEIARWLDHCGICVRGGYHCSALAHKTLSTLDTGAVRISFGYRNTERDVLECVKCLKKYQNN